MGMTVISMLLNVERSPNVFVCAEQLICDSVRRRPTGRLKSLVMPEIIIMSLQLVSVEKQSMQHQVDTPQPAFPVQFSSRFVHIVVLSRTDHLKFVDVYIQYSPDVLFSCDSSSCTGSFFNLCIYTEACCDMTLIKSQLRIC